jgi:hypothetical protein
MTSEELFVAIRERIQNPSLRIDAKRVEVPPLYGPARQNELDVAETEFGMPLPPPLKRLYVEVENGGFGPATGILGVEGGHTDIDGRTLIESYCMLRSQGWPYAILPLCDLGDAAWSCVDGRDPRVRVLTMDRGNLTVTRFDLLSWLEAWVSGSHMSSELFEVHDGSIMNPFTKKPVAVKRRGKAKGVPFEP